jgi:Predicted metal-binding integral membrane protein (DUF2182)
VKALLAGASRSAGIKLQSFLWVHPEWWTVGLAGGAWAVMLFHAGQSSGHGVRHVMTLVEETGYWMFMVAAMMLPLVTRPVRFTAAASLWARRHRAIAGFVLGYLAPWLALGLVAATLRQASWTHTYAAPALCFAAAALWRRTVRYKRALAACQRTWPIAPLGWRAHRDCLRFGSFIGLACVWTCWPLMLACGFAGHSLLAMTGGMTVGFVDQWRYRRRRRSPALGGTLAMAGYYTVLAALELGSAFTA